MFSNGSRWHALLDVDTFGRLRYLRARSSYQALRVPSGQFGEVAVVPDVNFVGHALDIAFGVKGHCAEYRVHRIARAQRSRDSRAICLAGAAHALGQRLHRRIAEQRETFRLETRRPELVDDMFGGFESSRIARKRE